MHEYPKIASVFQRDTEGSRKLQEGIFQDEAVAFLQNLPWICTEKIDGTNIGVVWDGHSVCFQGRTERANIPSVLLKYLMETFGKSDAEELFEQKFGETQVILFGEGYGAGIQKGGGNYRPDNAFILFDVYLPEQDLWLKRDAVEDIARAFSIDAVPVILTGTIAEAVAYIKGKPKSTIGTADMEGLVCRPAVDLRDRRGKRITVKVKAKDF